MTKIHNDVFKGRNPYLNAPAGRPIGTKSCTWRQDDRVLSTWGQIGEAFIVVLLVAGVVYLVV